MTIVKVGELPTADRAATVGEPAAVDGSVAPVDGSVAPVDGPAAAGTLVFRRAVMADTEEIYQLIQMNAELGLLLPRSRLSLYENLQCLTVIEEDGRIMGIGGLHILWLDLAEIRSLVISPDKKGQGLGKQLVHVLVEEADKLGIHRVLALTYQVAFFDKCGFRIVQKETLPHKVWKDCMHCRKFPTCDETAMILEV